MNVKVLTTALLGLATLALAACNVGSVAVRTCSALDVIYAHYDAVDATGAVPVVWQTRVATVREHSDRACANPAAMTTIELAAIAARAYPAIKGALEAAQGEGDADWDAAQGLNKLEVLREELEQLKKRGG